MAATRYRAPLADALRIVALDELTAIYHRASGITHLVDQPAPEIVAALAGDWMTADALLTHLVAAYDMPDADLDALVARLDELVEAGLIERA